MAEKKKYASVGGQAVMEGIMMRSPIKSVLAVRKPNGEIHTETVDMKKSIKEKYKFLALPVIRGVVSFVESMVVGYKSLMRSAEIAAFEDENEKTESEKAAEALEQTAENAETVNVDKAETKAVKDKKEKKKEESEGGFILYISLFLGVILGVGLFVALPQLITNYGIESLFNVKLGMWEQLVKGIIRILIVLLYILLVASTKEIKKLFKYHGAEHKTIFCFENREELTVENVKKFSRLHPRCGTSFLLIVMIVSILFYTFIYMIPALGSLNPFIKIPINLLFLPIVAGCSFEVLRFTGRHDNWFTHILAAPGKAFQLLTTKDPDDEQIEVAIVALKESLINEKTGEMDYDAAYRVSK